MRIAYFDCFSGISGDMTISAFLDAGLDFDRLDKELAKLKLKGYLLKKSKAVREGITATKFDCVVKDDLPGRSAKDILSIIARSGLSKRAKEMSSAIFSGIAVAETKVHGTGSARAHLHELGGIDSIIDIAGAAIAIEELGIEELHSSAVTLGRGLVKCAHGTLPVPAPATLELLRGVPVNVKEIDAELVTPTGAGILKALAKSFGTAPVIRTEAIGYGAGSRTIPGTPNMLRILVGETSGCFRSDSIFSLETNIDDMNPQNFEYLFERLFKEGALDAYTTNIQMKKSRPAFKLTVLAEPQSLERISSVIFSETTAIGLRYHRTDRLKLDRKLIKVNTRYGEISVKVSGSRGGVMTASPEYDQCVKIARAKKVPLKTVYDEAKKLVNV